MIRPVANRKCRVLIISIAAVHRGSQIRDLDVDGGAPAQRIELLRQPLTGRRPAHVAQVQEKPQSAESLLGTLSLHISASAEMAWISIFFRRFFRTAPLSIRPVTKLIARISRMSEELKLISLMRFRISTAVRGFSGRSGLAHQHGFAPGLAGAPSPAPRRLQDRTSPGDWEMLTGYEDNARRL